MSIRIFLAGDQSMIGHKVEAASREDPEIQVTGARRTLHEILEELRINCPDVVILHPEGTRSLEMIRPVNDLCPKTPVLLFAAADGHEIRSMAGTSGVAGYLLSDISPENLVRIIREVHQAWTTEAPPGDDSGHGQTFIGRVVGGKAVVPAGPVGSQGS